MAFDYLVLTGLGLRSALSVAAPAGDTSQAEERQLSGTSVLAEQEVV